MHAHLLIGRDKEKIEKEVEKIGKGLDAMILNFSMQKIEDVREFKKFASFKVAKKTIIFIKEVDTSSSEAANAFLKILEEPQENITLVLSATRESGVLPTIISRCQVRQISSKIKVSENDTNEIEEFLKMNIGKKFLVLEKARKREDAKAFLEKFITIFHSKIISGDSLSPFAKHRERKLEGDSFAENTKYLESAQETLTRINLNGNVSVQLTNFVVQTL